MLEKLKVKNMCLNVTYIFQLGLFYPVTPATVFCCILMQILRAVLQKKLQLLRPSDPLPGLRPWIPLVDFRPPDPSLLFMSPDNPVRSPPLPARVGRVGEDHDDTTTMLRGNCYREI